MAEQAQLNVRYIEIETRQPIKSRVSQIVVWTRRVLMSGWLGQTVCLTQFVSALIPFPPQNMKLCHKFVLLCMAVLLWAAVSEASPVKRQQADQTSVAVPRQSGGSAAQAVDEDDDGKFLDLLKKGSIRVWVVR